MRHAVLFARSLRPVVVAALAVGLMPALAGCAPTPDGFSVETARGHVRRLASDIGSRPAGSEANRQTREYVVAQLRASGFDVRVQSADAEWPARGVTARVHNVIATLPGRVGPAVALMTHYDSVPDGPGAADDALGVAVCLEAGRVLAARPSPRYGLVVIVTDGEELGLLGAAAVLKDPIRQRIRATLNFEAIGSSAPVMLFETGAASGSLLETWARHAPHPNGASFMGEIYELISRGGDRTDLGPFRRAGLPGLGFSAVGDSYTYHTPQDSAARLDAAALQQAGENAVAIVTALDAIDLNQPTETATTYFDVLGVTAFTYGHGGELIALALAVLVGLVAWAHVIGEARRGARASTLWMTVPWALVGTAAAGAAMTGGAWLLRAASGTLHPWYAHPDRFFLWLVLAGIAGGWLVMRAGALLPRGMRGTTQPAMVWALTLPAWIVLSALAAWYVPTSAFLVEFPLLVTAVALLLLPTERTRWMRAASAVSVIAVGVFVVRPATMLLHFLVPELGRAPLVTPLFVHPALLLAVGVFLVPPLLAMLGRVRETAARSAPAADGGTEGRSAGRLSGRVPIGLAVAMAASFAWCWLSPAYTAGRPQRHVIRYVADMTARQASWEVSGNEAMALPNGPWRPGGSPVSERAALGALGGGFASYASAPAPPGPPVVATGSVVVGSDAILEIEAVPPGPGWAIVLALPAGVVPLETNVAISMRRGRQIAVWNAVPTDGVTFRGRFEASDASQLRAAALVASTNGLPGAAWPDLPGWLPRERDVWQARSCYLLPVRWR